MSQKDIRQFFGAQPIDKTREEDVSTNDTTETSMLCVSIFMLEINWVCNRSGDNVSKTWVIRSCFYRFGTTLHLFVERTFYVDHSWSYCQRFGS